MATRTTYVGTESVGDPLTKANFDKGPGGLIGYSIITANQTGITTVADLTNFTLTFTPNSSRTIRIEWHLEAKLTTASTTDRFVVHLLKDGTQVASSMGATYQGVNETLSHRGMWIDVGPTNASHTYKLQGGVFSGSGTYQITGSSTEQNTFAAFDDGLSF